MVDKHDLQRKQKGTVCNITSSEHFHHDLILRNSKTCVTGLCSSHTGHCSGTFQTLPLESVTPPPSVYAEAFSHILPPSVPPPLFH